MAKIDWNRPDYVSRMDRDYWTNPKNGFDKGWHEKRKEIKLGIHEDHEWYVVKLNNGTHAGKVLCQTCGDKFVTWVPKGVI